MDSNSWNSESHYGISKYDLRPHHNNISSSRKQQKIRMYFSGYLLLLAEFSIEEM